LPVPELGRHAATECKGLIQCLDGARGRVAGVVKIDAILARQAGEGDPERAQLRSGQLEGGSPIM
jgi:hypothetical protein